MSRLKKIYYFCLLVVRIILIFSSENNQQNNYNGYCDCYYDVLGNRAVLRAGHQRGRLGNSVARRNAHFRLGGRRTLRGRGRISDLGERQH